MKVTCSYCGKTFRRSPSKCKSLENVFCSSACYVRYRFGKECSIKDRVVEIVRESEIPLTVVHISKILGRDIHSTTTQLSNMCRDEYLTTRKGHFFNKGKNMRMNFYYLTNKCLLSEKLE